jgi:hypothetical protein
LAVADTDHRPGLEIVFGAAITAPRAATIG